MQLTKHVTRPQFQFLIAVLTTVAMILTMVYLAAAKEPGNQHFQRTWERPDQPVASGQTSRTWMWGPEAFTDPVKETYAESSDGVRTVQYFDKSRMEITNPDGNPESDWYVTNGLLVVELMTGNLQTGDDRHEPNVPARVNVAGDVDDPTGPTYATLALVRDKAALSDGQQIIQRLDRNGKITTDPSLATYNVTAAERVTLPGIDHQVASPFWSFMNSDGLVFLNGQYTSGNLFSSSFYATGLPITEAYWAEVKVGGDYKDVLVQAFERRVLTFTPGNGAGWQVEAGNVGQHYYQWRYEQIPRDGEPGPTPVPNEPIPSPTEPSDQPTPVPTVPPSTPEPTPEPTPSPEEPVPPSASEYLYYGKWGQASNSLNTFSKPAGITTNGNQFIVVDEESGRVQTYDSNGLLIRAFGYTGQGIGQPGLLGPRDVVVDRRDGCIWVADTGNNRIACFMEDGSLARQIAGQGSEEGQFNGPSGVAIGPDGNLYIADTNNHRIQEIKPDGTFIKSWGTLGSGDGQFSYPWGIYVEVAGNVYVSDSFNHRIQKFNSAGEFIMAWGTVGAGDNQLRYPTGLTTGPDGNLLIADYGNNRLVKSTRTGAFLGNWGETGAGEGQFAAPIDVGFTRDGSLFVSDQDNKRIQKLSADYSYLDQWNDDSRGRFDAPGGIDIGVDGRVYVTDLDLNQLKVFDTDGNFIFQQSMGGDTELDTPYDVAVDPTGNIFVVDLQNDRIVRFDVDGEYVSSLGTQGVADGQFKSPTSVDSDADGNIYIVDSSNHRIQKFDPEGNFIAKWGSVGTGPGEFNSPVTVAVHGQSLFVVDFDNYRVQEFTLNGEFLNEFGSKGTANGQFSQPVGLDIDVNGYIYVTDTVQNRIQKFRPDGTFYASCGTPGTNNGEFTRPHGIAIASNGFAYVTDVENNRIQIFAPVAPAP